MGGFKFRRQYPIERYIVDFVCLEAQFIVEVDGGQHVDRRRYDLERTRVLARFGMTVSRYWSHDVLLRIDDVLMDIHSALVAPHPDPLPASGERESDP
jgi:lysyl-tRNA synthetase class 2